MVNTRDQLSIGLLPPGGAPPVEWRTSDAPVDYQAALAAMDARAAAIARGEAAELVWLLEHPALYTAGTRRSRTNCSTPDFRSTAPAAAGSSPITGLDNESAT